jgi:two-component system sensor histidine kinase DegS
MASDWAQTAVGRPWAALGSAALKRSLSTFVHQFRIRLHDRRFWVVQMLVVTICLGHSLLEETHSLGVLPDIALLPVSTYFIPIVYAALNFGVEGAVPTALWSAVLTVPNLILWHSGAQRPGVVLQLALLVAIAYVIARRVDFETAAKERAEAANARLERLNLTAAASAESLDLETVLARTAQAMLDPRRSQTSWIMLTPDGAGPEHTSVASTAGATELGERELAATRTVLRQPPLDLDGGTSAATIQEQRIAVVPLRATGRIAGAVGLANTIDALSTDDAKLLEAVANQLAVALGNIRHFRQTQYMVSELSQAQEALEDYVRLATDAQEEERKRLARELHDDTIQTLVIAKAELAALAGEKPIAATVRTRLENVGATLAAAIDDVRRFSRDLRPSLLDDLGLVDAVDWQVSDLAARTEINAQLRTRGEPRRLDQHDELALFRIVQEALHNVERHATATAVRVRIDFDQNVSATIIDNGNGFDVSKALADPHASTRLGLLGMRERAKLAGAEISIKSRPSSGTRITVKLAPTR